MDVSFLKGFADSRIAVDIFTKFDSINAELPVRKSIPRHLSTISANYSLFCLSFSIKDSPRYNPLIYAYSCLTSLLVT